MSRFQYHYDKDGKLLGRTDTQPHLFRDFCMGAFILAWLALAFAVYAVEPDGGGTAFWVIWLIVFGIFGWINRVVH